MRGWSTTVFVLIGALIRGSQGCQECICSYNEGYFRNTYKLTGKGAKDDHQCYEWCLANYPEMGSEMTCVWPGGPRSSCEANNCKTGYPPFDPLCANITTKEECNRAHFPPFTKHGCPNLPLDKPPYTGMGLACERCYQCNCTYSRGQYSHVIVSLPQTHRATEANCKTACGKNPSYSFDYGCAEIAHRCQPAPTCKDVGCETESEGCAHSAVGCSGWSVCKCPLTSWAPASGCGDD